MSRPRKGETREEYNARRRLTRNRDRENETARLRRAANPEGYRAANRAYVDRHRSEINARARLRDALDPESTKQRRRAKYWRNPEAHREAAKRHWANCEKCQERDREYKLANRELLREKSRVYESQFRALRNEQTAMQRLVGDVDDRAVRATAVRLLRLRRELRKRGHAPGPLARADRGRS